MKELCRASGGNCGGTSVDNAFKQIFAEIVGEPLLTEMQKENPSAYLDIFRELEAVKRTVYTDLEDTVTMSIPRFDLDKMCMKHHNKDFEAVVQSSPNHDKMIIVSDDSMIINTNLIIDMFKQASERIIELMSDALKEMKGSNLKMIFLVGGFSGCKIIQDKIKSFFHNQRVIVPENAELTILKGAVLFGHKPDYIVARIARYTYGVNTTREFNSDIHDLGRRVVINGKEKCDFIFDIYKKIGSVVKMGANITDNFKTVRPFQSEISFPIFRSTAECPQYTDVEDCTKLGTLRAHIQDPSYEIRDFRLTMIFGNTEFRVTVFDIKSGVECVTVLDLF